MKKKLTLISFLILITIFSLIGATACSRKNDQPTSSSTSSSKVESSFSSLDSSLPTSSSETSTSTSNSTSVSTSTSNSSSVAVKHLVTYTSSVGTGTPSTQEYFQGETFTIASNTFTYEGFKFIGWEYNDVTYSAGDSFTMPNSAVTFTAVWEEIITEFSQSYYEYDCLAGGDLELPLTLGNANIEYVGLDDELLEDGKFRYDAEKCVLVIDKMSVFTLSRSAEHTVLVITDKQLSISCSLEVTQSLKTTFDSQTTKSFTYGVDAGVTFSVGYNGTTPTALYRGEELIDDKYYSYDNSSFTLSEKYLQYFDETTDYKLVLSNNDVYSFRIMTNLLFATDYDLVTRHDTTISTIGHNPLYQYSTNVSIVNNADMGGNVLKIVPNTVEVTYDCNGYITLGNPSWGSTWKKVDVKDGKYYLVSFDYMTKNTSQGEFEVKSVYVDTTSSTWTQSLNFGSGYDNTVYHFETVISSAEFGHGIMIWAHFLGGGGEVYIDNYKLAELDTNTISTTTKLASTTANYSFNDKQEVVFYGHIEEGITLVSLKQVDKTYANNWASWDFAHNNDTKDYSSYASVVNGLDGEGKLVLNTALLDMLWGDTSFIAEFSDGTQCTLTVSSSQVDMFTDYDNTSIYGKDENGTIRYGHLLNSGLWVGEPGTANEISGVGGIETVDGDNAFYVRSTENAVVPEIFTIKINNHSHDWYALSGTQNNKYRVTFEYQISNLAQDSVYFAICALSSEDMATNFIGGTRVDIDSTYYEVRYYLTADGQKHTFDSGYFTYNNELRIVKIQMPSFTTTDNAFVMVDDYRVSHTTTSTNTNANASTIEGGRLEIGFEDSQSSQFTFHTERTADTYPYILDGKLYFWTLAEQWAVFNQRSYTDVDVSVDITTLLTNGKFDSGILIGTNLDNLNGWCVNIEKTTNASSFSLKLQNYINGAYNTVFAEIGNIAYVGDTINLRVVCQGGIINAYLNGSDTATLTYDTGSAFTGYVALKNYYSPNAFDNLIITGAGNSVDTSYMATLISKANALLQKDLANKTALQSAVNSANVATTQTQVDLAVEELENAISNATEKRTFNQLTDLLLIANNIENTDNLAYTTNSWNSFIEVKEICSNLSSSSSDVDISYWYARLQIRIDNLIEYNFSEVA